MIKVRYFSILFVDQVQKFIEADTLTEDALLVTPWARDIAVATPGASVLELHQGARCCDSDISGPRCRQKRIFCQVVNLYDLLDLVNLKYGKALKFHHVVLAYQTGRADRKK